MGEGNSLVMRRREKVLYDTLLASAAIYQGMYEEKDGKIPCSFQIVYMIGWKHHDSQQKPKPRGSAEFSLKELAIEMDTPLGTLYDEEEDPKKK